MFNEAYEQRQAYEESLIERWGFALEKAGIADEYMAKTTAILLENYANELEGNQQLLMEDQITTGSFTGVNLAILGLLTRVVPNLIGAELAGIQALTTPKAPVFVSRFFLSDKKGRTNSDEELWRSPVDFSKHELGFDPDYSSQIVIEDINITDASHKLGWGNEVDRFGNQIDILAGINLSLKDAVGNVLSIVSFPTGDFSTLNSGVTVNGVPSVALSAGQTIEYSYVGGKKTIVPSVNFDSLIVNVVDDNNNIIPTEVKSAVLNYEYANEDEGRMASGHFMIEEIGNINLIKRQLSGSWTIDSQHDLKQYHGIDVESEITNMMKTTLMAEINRETVRDIRTLAKEVKTLDINNHSGFTSGNYDDVAKLILDAINYLATRIWVNGRLGKANWVLANPETLSFLDRTYGFVGAGASYSGKDIAFVGTLSNKIKVYHDPLYPKGEILMGYKGSSPTETGYIHCPYLPITPSANIIDPETGNYKKFFYTRYGKTFDLRDGAAKANKILNGENQYARLIIKGMPEFFV